jgi:hypothetical protein
VQIDLSQQAPAVGLPVTGQSLWLLNAQELEFWDVPTDVSPAILSPALIGFDRRPEPKSGGYDLIVPPNSQAVFPLPDGTRVVWVAYVPSGVLGASAVARLQAFFLPCVSSPAMTPMPSRDRSPLGVGAAHGPVRMIDFDGNLWPRDPQTPVLFQALRSGGVHAYLRPRIAPSQVDVLHVAATGVNTVFDFSGPQGLLNSQPPDPTTQIPPPVQVVHRIYVSVSAACLFVLGAPGLGVQDGDPLELGRLNFPAAGIQVLDYGEGLEVNFPFSAGAWQAYTSADVTLDATMIGG